MSFGAIRNLGLAVFSLGILCLAEGKADAEIIGSGTRIDEWHASGAIPLTQTGGTAINFSTSAVNQKVVINYNAACNTDDYLYIQILVDGRPTNPNVNAYFCTDVSAISVSRQAIYTIPKKGAHSVTVIASQTSGSFTLRQSSIVVEK